MLKARRGLDRAHYDNLDLFADSPVSAPATATPVELPLAVIELREEQLDLFVDTPATQSAQRARRALLAGDIACVYGELALLDLTSPELSVLVRRCLHLVDRQDARWRYPALALPWIESELAAAANELLGAHSDRLIGPAVRELIAFCEDAPYDHANASVHASTLWQRLGEYRLALEAVEAHPVWRFDPFALRWHADLSQQAGDAVRLLADCAELCFAHPEHAEMLLASNRSLVRRWEQFCEIEPMLPIWAFPAWGLLLARLPFVAGNDARPGPQLLAAAAELAATRGQDVHARRALHARCPELLRVYLRAR